MLAGLSFRRRLRYQYAMSGFVEKTVAEAGFAASWAQHVAPLAERFDVRRRRQLLFASLVTGLAAGLAVVTVMLSGSVHADNIMANPLYASLVLALAALAAIASWVTMLRRDMRLSDAVDLAVETHFAALFAADGNEAFAEVVLQDLVEDGILEDATHSIQSGTPAPIADAGSGFSQPVRSLATANSCRAKERGGAILSWHGCHFPCKSKAASGLTVSETAFLSMPTAFISITTSSTIFSALPVPATWLR